ncbi:MAG TPA: tetratricopeptide repeat protein [Rectinemataceae bacterium]
MKRSVGMSPRLSEELEERLRPNRFLGYDRDHVGVALLRREMFDAAESQFRRAIYLNPMETGFKVHLAWCLYKMDDLDRALAVVNEVFAEKPDDPDAPIIRDKILAKKNSNQLSGKIL